MLSPYLAAILLAWIIVQGAKFLIASVKQRGAVDVSKLYSSGGMPSAHSASVVALLTTIGIKDGTDSALFALAALLAGIVMYDAMMVRRSSGEQGSALQALIADLKSKIRPPRSAKGHEPQEVAVGAVIGFAIGFAVVFWIS